MQEDTRYVARAGRDGWLRIRLQDSSEQSLPQFLKVRIFKVNDGREYFEILEGALKGKKGSVVQQGWLVAGAFHRPAATVVFDRAKQMLWFGGHGPFNAFTGGFNSPCPTHIPVPRGSYPLQIPFAPSQETRTGYYDYTDFHKTWFRIGLNPLGDRFLHVGEISHGCVTVRPFIPDFNGKLPRGFEDLALAAQGPSTGCIGLPLPATVAPVASWTEIYDYLMRARASDASVGTLTVL